MLNSFIFSRNTLRDDSASNTQQPVASTSRGSGGWVRGMPLVESYKTDEDLPENLRQHTPVLGKRKIGVTKVNVEMNEEYDDAEKFEWKSINDWRGVKEPFTRENPGPTTNFDNAYNAFRSYWDDLIVSRIATETNTYAQDIKSESFRQEWFDTNRDEILILFSFWIMIGIIKMPTIKSCFSNNPLLRTDIFRQLFSESRYSCLNQAFHIARGSHDPNTANNLLYPIPYSMVGPMLDHLNTKFKEHYVPSQDIYIDESPTLWKGSLRFKQDMETKVARYGIKTYQLCESVTGYVWSFFAYVGRQTTDSTLSTASVSTVMMLTRPLLGLGHTLYLDDQFSSPALARYLKRRQTDCVGTLSPHHVPSAINEAVLADGQCAARHCGDVMVMSLQNRKRLSFITTCHGLLQIRKDNQCFLHVSYDYKRCMGGVNRLDLMLEPYNSISERDQCSNWTMKLFKSLLNFSIENARILMERSAHKKLDAIAFRVGLVQIIIDRHLSKVPMPKRTKTPEPFPTERLTGRHFISRIPITEEMRLKVKYPSGLGRKTCVWCTYNRRTHRTMYECPDCRVPLCVQPCFKEYHTVPT